MTAGTLLEAVARARDLRNEAEQAFRDAIATAHRAHTWNEIAKVAGLSYSAVRYLTMSLEERRRWNNHRGGKTDAPNP